jgi:hypothetical protein
MTLGNMCAKGVRSFAVLCWTCQHDAVLPIAVLMSRDCHASQVADVHRGRPCVRGSEWQQIATKPEIRQAYLSLGGPQHD